MISVSYVQTMARYNEWQNAGLIELLGEMSEAELWQDRGAFFGSILGTLNHLLYGDTFWMSRFDGWRKPEGSLAESPDLTPTYAAWKADRQRADQRIVYWAETLRPIDLRGDLVWYSGLLGREQREPKAKLVVHFFNHQTHHRGQVHAMLTAAGKRPHDTDLSFMPREAAG